MNNPTNLPLNEENLPFELLENANDQLVEIPVDATIPVQVKAGQVISALETFPEVFKHGDCLAIIREGCLIVAAETTMLMTILFSFFLFTRTKVSESGEQVITYCSLSKDLLLLIQDKIKTSKIREVVYFSKIPVLEKLPDFKFSICQDAYNPNCKIYVAPNNLMPIPGFKLILKLLNTFDFRCEIDMINILGFLFLPFIHHFLPGLVPSIIIEANQRGSGKTLLANFISIITQGKIGHTLSLNDDEAELEKRIGSMLMVGEHTALFDNVKKSKSLKEIGGTFIERMTTSPILHFRLLGKNEIFCVPNTLFSIITTNGAKTSSDYASRSVSCELYVQGNPILRKFENKDLLGSTSQYLDQIHSELLAGINKWIEQGCPLSTSSRHRCDVWAEITGGILEANGFTGFLSNQDEFQKNSGLAYEFSKCLIDMPKNHSLTARQILDRCRPKNEYFLEWESVPMFSKKVLMSLIGEKFDVEGESFIFEKGGINTDKSALFKLSSVTTKKSEQPENDNVITLPHQSFKTNMLFESVGEGR